MDVYAIFQASATISDEVDFEKLIKKMMNIVLTSSGAEYALLMLNKEDADELEIVASSNVNGQIKIYEQQKEAKELTFPITIIDYVVSSRETVILDDASQDGKFSDDQYIILNNTKSILCFPILYKGELTGVLYLENNQSPNAFTKSKMNLLMILASQAAISIENTYLYGNLERKVIERTRLLNEVNKNLMDANNIIARTEEQKRELIANISHDIRSPLATVRGYIDVILDGLVSDPKKQKDYLQVMKSRLSSLNGLVQDLFELTQLETGNSTFTMDIVAIDKLFTHLCGQFKLEVENEGIEYETILPQVDGQNPLLEVDTVRMEQVMANLITNIVKHAGASSVKIKLSITQSDQAIITIKDHGIGVSESEIPYLFDRFYTKSKKREAHGLGLAISKEIIEYHNGKIKVISQVGEGTTFIITLPTFDI